MEEGSEQPEKILLEMGGTMEELNVEAAPEEVTASVGNQLHLEDTDHVDQINVEKEENTETKKEEEAPKLEDQQETQPAALNASSRDIINASAPSSAHTSTGKNPSLPSSSVGRLSSPQTGDAFLESLPNLDSLKANIEMQLQQAEENITSLPQLPGQDRSKILPLEDIEKMIQENSTALEDASGKVEARALSPRSMIATHISKRQQYDDDFENSQERRTEENISQGQKYSGQEPFVQEREDAAGSEEEDEDAIMDPNDPLMKRVQDALNKQLLENQHKLQLSFVEMEEKSKRAFKHREEVGVELYGLQQQLARTQAQLESIHDQHNIIQSYREESELVLQQTSEQYQQQVQRRKECLNTYEERRAEQEKVSNNLFQVSMYNEELKSKIAVTKRSTLKAEEDLVKKEILKKKQDYYIDRLHKQVKRLQERYALYESQLQSQKKETNAAHETLQEALMEMEVITFEKRQLLHQWKSSIIALEKREETLNEIQQDIEMKKDISLNMEGEINGFKHALRKAQERNENLTLLNNKLESESDMLKRQIQGIHENKEKLKESFSTYSKCLAQTEQELSQVMQERSALKLDVEAVQKQTNQVISQTQKLQNEIAEHLQNQLSIDKGSLGTKKDSQKLRLLINEKNSQMAQIRNETSTMRMEILNFTSGNQLLKEQLEKIDRQLSELNNLIETYELEIRRRNDELSKKQGEMDMLNKKYDQLTSGRSVEESIGPLEATIHNLTKSVTEKEKECTQLQQYWLKSQSELVILTKQAAELSEVIQDLKMRHAVLKRKKSVVKDQFEMEERNIKEIQRSIHQQRNGLTQISTLITKNATMQAQLEENNLGLEQEFRRRLKEAEFECIQLEKAIDILKEEKSTALNGLIEAERQIMLWEQKIQLAKETQAALDPNIGAVEIKEMTLEIHRMKLRHHALLKLQEKMITEMEQSVERREAISTKGKLKSNSGQYSTMIQKAIVDLNRKVKQTVEDIKECNQDIENLISAQEKVAQQVEQANSSYQELLKAEQQRLGQLHEKFLQRSRVITHTSLAQKKAKRYQELIQLKYVYAVKDPEGRHNEIQRAQQRHTKVCQLIKELEEAFGDKEQIPPDFELIHILEDINSSAISQAARFSNNLHVST